MADLTPLLYRLIEENWLAQFGIDTSAISNQQIDALLNREEVIIKSKQGKMYKLSLKDSEFSLELIS